MSRAHPLRVSVRNLWLLGRGSLSSGIAGLCVVIYVAVGALDRSGLVSRDQVLLALGCSYDGVVRHHWIHQLITAALLHGGVIHLSFNMLSLWMLGPAVERQLGRARYVLFSMVCAISGFAGFLLFDRAGNAVAIGYSGVVFGLLVAQAFLYPDVRVRLFWAFPLKMKHAAMLLGAIELYLTVSPESGGVAHSAHLFGALVAVVWLAPSRIRRRTAIATAPAPATSPTVPAPRDRGEAGDMIAESIRHTGGGDFAAARQCLGRCHSPWSLRRAVRGVNRLISLAEQFDTDASDAARGALERQVVVLWRQLAANEVFVALPPLADVGLRCGGEHLTPLLVDTLSGPCVSGMPVAIRQRLEAALAETGASGVEAVIIRMADVATAPDASNRLLVSLPALKLQQHAPAVMKFYDQSGAEERALLVDRLARMRNSAAGALCDLLAGACSRMPADLRLARAIQERIGERELEQIAVRWAAGGHRGAQTVLRRLYEYSGST